MAVRAALLAGCAAVTLALVHGCTSNDVDCGNLTCHSGEYCIHPSGDCAQCLFPDGGDGCPAGSSPGCLGVANGERGCTVLSPTAAPYCSKSIDCASECMLGECTRQIDCVAPTCPT
jgi:hypothetical protein